MCCEGTDTQGQEVYCIGSCYRCTFNSSHITLWSWPSGETSEEEKKTAGCGRWRRPDNWWEVVVTMVFSIVWMSVIATGRLSFCLSWGKVLNAQCKLEPKGCQTSENRNIFSSGMFHVSWAQAGDLEVSLDELYCTCGDERGYSLVDNALNSLAGGGVGIHRRDPARKDFDYGAEYRAKVRWATLAHVYRLP